MSGAPFAHGLAIGLLLGAGVAWMLLTPLTLWAIALFWSPHDAAQDAAAEVRR